MKDTAGASLTALLDKAEASLSAHRAEHPDSKHNLLATFYAEIRANAPRREAYSSARDLSWDDPKDKNEEQCLNDAIHVFLFIREHQ